MICADCQKVLSEEFRFCPYCGKVGHATQLPIELPNPEAGAHKQETAADLAQSGVAVQPGGALDVGAFILWAFAAISLFVSAAKGFPPLYLFESGAWAFAAWYWHRTKTKRRALAKALVALLGIAVGIGEIVHFAEWANSTPQSSGQSESNFNPEAPGAVPVPAAKAADLSCPGALPAETTIAPLTAGEASKIIGSQGDLYKDGTSWSARLTYMNTTVGKCVTSAVVDLDLSYEGKDSKQRISLTFSPPLGPGMNQTVFSTIRSPKRGEDVSLSEWHTVSVSGFGGSESNPFAEFFGH